MGVLALGTRPVRPRVAVVVVGNALWARVRVRVRDSFPTAFAGGFPVTGPGVAVIVAQTIAVTGCITLQVPGPRRSA